MSLIESVRPCRQADRDPPRHPRPPELAFEERRTAELVARHLEALGIETHRGIGGTGVVGVVRGRRGLRAIGLRADMDALPITERNEFAPSPPSRAACTPAVTTVTPPWLLGAAGRWPLARLRRHGIPDLPARRGRRGGAPAMIADGLFERFPMEAVFGMHNWPGMEAGASPSHAGPVMASADRFDIRFTGVGAHAAMPHLGVDRWWRARPSCEAAQTLVSRVLDPIDAGVVSVTQFHAGEAYNVIPDRAELCGTVRTFSAEVRDRLERGLRQVAEGIAQSHGVEVDFQFRRGYPPTVNTAAEAALCAEAARGGAGADGCSPTAARAWARRISLFPAKKPGAYVAGRQRPGRGRLHAAQPQLRLQRRGAAGGRGLLVRAGAAPARRREVSAAR